jgi:hypothetical protein
VCIESRNPKSISFLTWRKSTKRIGDDGNLK